MPWTEVAPGRFERDFESLENFYRSIAAAGAPLQREHFQVLCIAKINPVPSEQDFRAAWATLRNHHPLLAGLDEGNRYVYQVPDDQALQAWIDKTCHYATADGETTVQDLLRSPKPATLIRIHVLARTGEIVIQNNHWRMDGIGAMNLTNALLKILADPVPVSSLQWSSHDTLPKLTPGIDEVVYASKDATPERAQKAKQLMDGLVSNPATMAFKTSPAQLPEATGRGNLMLTEEESLQVMKACKAHGISVSVGVHTALVLAGQRLDDVQAKSTDGKYVYTDQITVSLRKYLQPPFNSDRVPLTIYHTGVPMTVDVPDIGTNPVTDPYLSSLVFAHVAQQISKTYRKDHTTMFDYLVQWVDTIVAFYASPPQPDGPPPPALPDLSSLGILEKHLQHTYNGANRIELQDWSVVVEILDKHVMCHCWTWYDRLHLQALYNEAFYEKAFIDKLLDEWKAILLNELA